MLAASTPEVLMRARYAAYVVGDISYLEQTLHPSVRMLFDRKSARIWSESAEWLGLEIKAARGSEGSQEGQVEFIAHYRQDGTEHAHHEVSVFKKLHNQWYFVDGRAVAAGTVTKNVRRNDPCPCGSGKKYKRCCGESKAA
jgi:SEC-C motif-containing protein